MKLSTILLAIFAPLAVLGAAAPDAEPMPEAVAQPAAVAEPVAEPVTEAVPVATVNDKRWPPPRPSDCLKPCRRQGYKCPKGYVSSKCSLAHPYSLSPPPLPSPTFSFFFTWVILLCKNHDREKYQSRVEEGWSRTREK
jgi:hypothetical protein